MCIRDRLFVGRLMWYKGIKIILDALARLKSQGLDFKMVFVGGGMDMEEIEKYSESAGLTEKVIFTGPINDRQLLRKYFCMGDLFLFPSTFDTNGLVVREAAACALASVLIEGSAAAEGITHNVTGFLCQEDHVSFAAAVKGALSNMPALKTVGENAQRHIYISWDDSVKKARDRYMTVIENYRLRGSSGRKKLRSDDVFEFIGNMNRLLDRLREAGDKAGGDLKKTESFFRELLNRIK